LAYSALQVILTGETRFMRHNANSFGQVEARAPARGPAASCAAGLLTLLLISP